MKPEQLKNKGFCRAILEHPLDCIKNNTCKARAYNDYDIKSAVEWLKQELQRFNTTEEINDAFTITTTEINNAINKAFEDVIKNG